MPQIEVTFDIDANGILNVSAKDKTTGKQQSIVIKASSGLSEEEIQRMVRDAEENREADKKFHELADARNSADMAIHAVNKSLTELGSDVPEDERKDIEAAIEALKTAMKSDDKAAIEEKTQALSTVSGKLMERLQAKKGAEQQTGAEQQQSTNSGQTDAGKNHENVVDAEFEEVKGDDQK
jgi:molecular chaperone DnaK